MATHAAPSSGSLEWDTYIEQDTALQAVAEHIWRVAQVLNETTGYSGVREMTESEWKRKPAIIHIINTGALAGSKRCAKHCAS